MNFLRAKWLQLTEWACWQAWNYARKREMARNPWTPGDPEYSRDDSPEYRRIIANEARQLLDNRHFKEAFGAVDAWLEAQAMSCDPDNKDKAQRILITKHLLGAIRREIVRKAEDGYMAEVQINELERRKKFLRMVR